CCGGRRAAAPGRAVSWSSTGLGIGENEFIFILLHEVNPTGRAYPAAQPLTTFAAAFLSPRLGLKIAVCLKRVADTVAKITIGPDGKSIDESGIKFVLNPYDEFAVEEAIALKEKAGAGETVAYSVGTDATQETLRAALSMGIDRAVLLQSP